MTDAKNFDVIILGAGAAGLMCAIEAGKRRRSTIVLERNSSVGEKIRISGGGRCNFTNTSVAAGNFISTNKDFCRSALARFTPRDFISLLEKHHIGYHEKKLGQLFCNETSREILSMLQKECRDANVMITTNADVRSVTSSGGLFEINLEDRILTSRALVVSTGGLSIPKLGATDIGYRIAKQFGLAIVETKPGLVPLKFSDSYGTIFSELSGISLDAVVSLGRTSFRENILFTHRGLSGPAILQISSYWDPEQSIHINLLPEVDAATLFGVTGTRFDKILARHMPSRFSARWCQQHDCARPVQQISIRERTEIAGKLNKWELSPSGTEGYEKAEVTCGGVDTRGLSSKSMEALSVPGLYFVGEVVDVTGWLGGYNFQWAWASGFAAGQFV